MTESLGSRSLESRSLGSRSLGSRGVFRQFAFITIAVVGVSIAPAEDRMWHDKSGKVEIEGELFARNESTAVIESNNADHSLVSLVIADLSEEDQAFLKQSETDFHAEKSESGMKSWHLRDGRTLKGQVVDYVHHDFVIQRRRGKAYVNNRLYDKLPKAFQRIVHHLVSLKDGIECRDDLDFEKWLVRQHGRERHIESDGVLIEFDNGDLHPIPFSAFASKERAMLEGGFGDWKKDKDDEEAKRRESLHLQAEAAAYKRDVQQQRRIATLSLQFQEYNSGLFDLWQVELVPNNGGRSRYVVVPGRTNVAASAIAVRQYPGYQPRAIARLQRR